MTQPPSGNDQDPTNDLLGQHNDVFDLSELLSILIEGKWLVLLVTLVVLSFGIIKALLDKPVYKADAMLQVNENTQTLAGF